MCLIVFKPKGVKWDFDALENGFWENPDGAGIMYQTKGGVRIEKGFTDPEVLIQLLEESPQLVNVNVVVHFRYATHGTVGVANCHPFPVAREVGEEYSTLVDIGIAHNGIIPGMRADTEKSDTVQYIENTLSGMKDKLFYKRTAKKLIKETFSKFAIMDKNRVNLIGEFIEDSGLYYSNEAYKCMPQLPATECSMAKSFTQYDTAINGFDWANWEYGKK